MDCEVCQKSVEPESKFCRHCGAKLSAQLPLSRDPQAEGLSSAHPDEGTTPAEQNQVGAKDGPDLSFLWKTSGLIAIIFVLGLGIGEILDGRRGQAVNDQIPSDQVSVEQAVTAANQAAIEAEAAAKEAESAIVNAAKVPESSRWAYSQDEDKVRGGVTYYAETVSTNSIVQSSPYSDTTTMKITVRKSPAYGTDVLLTISSGQMMCPSYTGCSGTVRFDDGPAQRISFNGPADNSSDTVFVAGAKSFISKMKKAKRVVIEKTLYQAGNPQFIFEVEGLKWEH